MITAAAILDTSHPLNKSFSSYCEQKGIEQTKRQARQFLKAYPFYQQSKVG